MTGTPAHRPFAHRFESTHAESPTAPPQTEDYGQDQEQPETDPRKWEWIGTSGSKLAQGVIFGLIFGFLLQKGGVAKFDILVGVLLLENFVVVKVMLSAIIVGMLGVLLLERVGWLEPQIKETVYGADILGGLIFGVGFGLIAYCPGTNAAAVGQGNLDAIIGILGMVFGSYLFALSSKFTGGTVSTWGKRGKLILPNLLGVSRGLFTPIFALVLAGVLIVLEVFFGN